MAAKRMAKSKIKPKAKMVVSPASRPYDTAREIAWRNIMVSAINEGLRLGVFGLDRDEAGWPGSWGNKHEERSYPFTVSVGAVLRHGLASVRPVGYGELRINAALDPIEPEASQSIMVSYSKRKPEWCETWASGYLERKDGKWLQRSERPKILAARATMEDLARELIPTAGYGDSGRFYL